MLVWQLQSSVSDHLSQMPPQKVKRGGARENVGRNVVTGKFSKDKTPEEKSKSHRERMAEVRGQQKVPEERIVVASAKSQK